MVLISNPSTDTKKESLRRLFFFVQGNRIYVLCISYVYRILVHPIIYIYIYYPVILGFFLFYIKKYGPQLRVVSFGLHAEKLLSAFSRNFCCGSYLLNLNGGLLFCCFCLTSAEAYSCDAEYNDQRY